MKKTFLLALTAVLTLACSSGKDEPYVPFTQPDKETTEEGETSSGSTPSVTTGEADLNNITATTALLTHKYSGAPSAGTYDRGVYYGLSQEALDKKVALNSNKAASGSFKTQLVSLEPATTYYYKAYITVWDAQKNQYADYFGEVKHFTTDSASSQGNNSSVPGLQYLNCYEIPALALKSSEACSNSGEEQYYHPDTDEYEKGDALWYNYYTTDDKRMVVTHTYAYEGKTYRNWTALVDRDRKGPLWVAFPMHAGAYPKILSGRSNNWTPDPGIPESWQQSEASSNFSRGHFCASNYRQTSDWANRGTFYYTNQALQWQNGFNSGIWSSLEGDVQANAPTERDTLYVVVGVLYEGTAQTVTTNSGKQAVVPSHFYKCLMQCSFDTAGNITAAKGCAYVYTNENHSGNYSQGITTIDTIEQRSGWDFFTHVPKTLQDAAEAQNTKLW